MYLGGGDQFGMYTRPQTSAQGRPHWQNLVFLPPGGEEPEPETMGLAGCGCNECESCLGAYLDGYMGQDSTPWWQQLLTAGTQVATTVIKQQSPTYTAPYNPYGTSPVYGPANPGSPGLYIPPQEPSYVPTQETNWLPYILGGGLLLYLVTR